MKSRIEKALRLHENGYNCSQSVACAYCDLVGVNEDTMFKLCEGFGAGMGGMEGTCGAVSGAVVLAGAANSNGRSGKLSKGETYKLSRIIRKAFVEKNGSLICKELKGSGTGRMLRSCDGCVEDAAAIVETLLFPDLFD